MSFQIILATTVQLLLSVNLSANCAPFIFHKTERHHYTLRKKWSFPLRTSPANVTNLQFPTDLVTFIEETLDGKLHFLCSDINGVQQTEKYWAYPTFNALRSLSKLCPISMVVGSNRLDRISCISSMVVSTSCKSSFVTPLNLNQTINKNESTKLMFTCFLINSNFRNFTEKVLENNRGGVRG